MASVTGSAPAPEVRSSSPLGTLARLYWMLFGNFLLMLLAVGLLLEGGWSWRDAAFFAVAASILVIRAVDTAKLGGATADGRRSTAADVRRHAWVLSAAVVATWGMAKLLAYLGALPQ